MSLAGLILYHLCRLLLGGLFLYAGVVKGADVAAFAGSVANYRILPYSWNYVVAAAFPYVEILAGLLLLINRKVRPSALLLGWLNVVFILALISVVARGLDIDCGCFSPSGKGHTTAQMALLRDAGIMVLVVVTYWLRGKVSS